jgi:hypothetical protein
MREWTCLGKSRFFLWRSGLRTTRNWDGGGHIAGPFSKEREKGRTPSCFTSTIQETRVTLPALNGAHPPVLVHLVHVFHPNGHPDALVAPFVSVLLKSGDARAAAAASLRP